MVGIEETSQETQGTDGYKTVGVNTDVRDRTSLYTQFVDNTIILNTVEIDQPKLSLKLEESVKIPVPKSLIANRQNRRERMNSFRIRSRTMRKG